VLAIALFFAFIFTQGVKGERVFRSIFFFPQVLSGVMVGVVWNFVLHPTIGLLNGALRSVGLTAFASFPWLGEAATVLPAILLVAVWQSVGFYLVLFISAMSGIPTDYYEAARLDGAEGWQLFRRITLPLITDTVRVGYIFLAISAMDMFGLVYTMTNASGGPQRAADVLTLLLTRTAFTDSQFGYATAMALVLLVLVLGISGLSLLLSRREQFEY
jgi:N-acetylglucosamine transport system permease protein